LIRIGTLQSRIPADALVIAAFSLACSLLLYALQGDVMLGIADEGFLWYGAWRTSLGEIPVRDFQSYDPGRYYWSSAWLRLFGSDVSTLRLSTAAFQAVGTFFGMMTLRRVAGAWWYVLAGGMILCLWMYPRYKTFEPAIALAGVYVAVRLVDNPSVARHLAAGLFLGVAAWFGRNHGTYGAAALSVLLLFVYFKIEPGRPVPRMLGFGAGVLLGYLPMLLMMAMVPGYFDSYISRLVVEMARLGSTNLPRDISWPWVTWAQSVDAVGYLVTLRSASFLIGLIYFSWPLIVLAAFLYLLTRKTPLDSASRVLLSASAFALPYYHYALSRADFDHVTMSIAPLLVLVMTIPFLWTGRARRVLAVIVLSGLSLGTYYTAGKATYLYRKLNLGDLKEVGVLGDRLLVTSETASVLRALATIKNDFLATQDAVVVLPFWPAAYVILDKAAPIWDLYLVSPRSVPWQEREIDEMDRKRVKWAIVGDVAIDGNDDLRMSKTNPLIWQYFEDGFEEIPVQDLPNNYRFLKRKDPQPAR